MLSTTLLPILGRMDNTEYKLVRQFSHPVETVSHNWLPPRLPAISCFRAIVHGKWLSVESVREIMLPVETLCRKHKYADILDRKPFSAYSSLCRKQEIVDSLDGSHIWRTVPVESENWRISLYLVGGLVYCDIHLPYLCFGKNCQWSWNSGNWKSDYVSTVLIK